APDAPVSELANWSNPFMIVSPKRVTQSFARAPQPCINSLTGQTRLGADLFCWRQLEIAHQHQAAIQRIQFVEGAIQLLAPLLLLAQSLHAVVREVQRCQFLAVRLARGFRAITAVE